jgi:hypothetical protein
MIFITGDTHGKYDITKLNSKSFPLGRQLTKDEVIIIAKISFLSNNVPRQNNYEIMFRNIDGKWMLSKYGFYN